MRFRKITALLMAAAMTVSLAACGSGSSNAPAETAAGETKTQEAADTGAKEEKEQENTEASGEKVKMTVSVWDNASSPQFQAMADAFMEKHPEVEVELIDTQADEYDNKLTVMLAGGDSDPDVIMVKNAETQVTMKDKNQLLDLTDYIARDGVDLSLYNGAAEQLQMDGKQYTLPFRQDWYMLFYNKDLFDEHGVDYLPANPDEALSWDEFVEVCQKPTIDENGNNAQSPDFDPDRIATYGFDFDKNNMTWGAFVYQNGGSVLNEDGTEFSMTDPKTVDVLQKIGDLINVYHVSPDPLTSSGSNMSVTSSLQSKQVAIICDGTWTNLDLGAIDIDYDVACLPSLSGKPCFETTASACVIFNTCKNVDVAWDFMMYLADPANALELYSSGLWMPIMQRWYEDEALLNSWASPETTSHTEGFYDAAVRYTEYEYRLAPESCVAGWSRLDAVIESALDSVWLGEKTAEDAMNEIKPSVDGMVSGFITFK